MATNMELDGGRRGNRLRPFVWGAAACLLALPLVAMQFANTGVDWTGADFAAMGMLLALACGTYELGAWVSGNTTYRAAFALAVVAGFLVVWANLAVGMIGDENDAVNLSWAGVLLVGIVGAAVARLRARGMAVAMTATAIAHLAVCAVALVAGWDDRGALVSAVFALPWIASALVFRNAARREAALGAR